MLKGHKLLRLSRKKAKLSKQAMADIGGVHLHIYNAYEKGLLIPSIQFNQNLSKHFQKDKRVLDHQYFCKMLWKFGTPKMLESIIDKLIANKKLHETEMKQ